MKHRLNATWFLLAALGFLAIMGCRRNTDGTATPVPDGSTPVVTLPSDGTGDPSATPVLMCTPPACAPGEMLACGADECPGGCGTICVPIGSEQPPTEPEQPGSPVVSQPVATPVIVEPPAGGTFTPGTTVQHQVRQGEWLLQIARCYGASYTAVRQANPLFNVNIIYPGSTIIVPNVGSEGEAVGPPCVQQYTVQAGDTWQSLAQQFQTTVAILQRANPGLLTPGRQIYVPSTRPATTTPPVISHDLLFLDDGDVAVWRGANGRVEITPDDQTVILELSTNAAGELALLRQTRDGNSTTEIALLNRTAGTLTVLESGLPADMRNEFARSQTMLLSPDGRWGVYLVRDGNSSRLTQFNTADPGSRRDLSGFTHGVSENIRAYLFPGSDNDHFLWLDEAGIFQFDYALQTGEQPLITINPDDLSGALAFRPVAWSPAGRYLLLEGGFFEGSAYFIMDSETAALAMLPDSNSYVTVATSTWRPDGTLFVFAPPQTGEQGLHGAHYQLEPAEAALWVNRIAGQTVVPTTGTIGEADIGFTITAPSAPGGEQPVLSLQGSGTADGLWTVSTGQTWQMNRLNQVPATVAFPVTWVPDGSGALFITRDNNGAVRDVVYVAADETGSDGSRPFSLGTWLSTQLTDFHWIQR